MSARESIFAALFAKWSALSSVRALRNEVLPERLDDGSPPLLVQQDGGDVPEPEVTMSPLAYSYDETVQLEVALQQGEGREAAMDSILAALGTALSADRTLGGLADDVRVTKAPRIEDRAVMGAAPLKVATVDVTVQYTTSDPLS